MKQHAQKQATPQGLRGLTRPDAMRRAANGAAKGLEPCSDPFATARFAHDFSRIPLHSNAPVKLQAKLVVNSPGDVYEQEADRVTEQVMRALLTPSGMSAEKSNKSTSAQCSCRKNDSESESTALRFSKIQHDGDGYSKVVGGGPTDVGKSGVPARAAFGDVEIDDSGDEVEAETEIADAETNNAKHGDHTPAIHLSEQPSSGNLRRSAAKNIFSPVAHAAIGEVLASPGIPLDGQTRAIMEPIFGHDFGSVRIHANPKAAQSARAVGAYAYTVGNNIVFDTGEHAPGTDAGRRLLAHELTHVVQQGGRTASADPRQVFVQRQVKVSVVETNPSSDSITTLTSNPNRMGLSMPESVRVKLGVRRSLDGLEPAWRAKVKGVVGLYSRQVRLLPGPPKQSDVSRNLGDGTTTKKNFCAQVTELHSLGNTILPLDPPERWYMLDAVKAHENVHISRFKAAAENVVPDIKQFFSFWTVPTSISAAGKKPRKVSKAEAVGQIRNSPIFTVPVGQSFLAWRNEATKLVKGDHAEGGLTDKAEHSVVDPVVRHICNYAKGPLRKTQGWPDCPVCNP